MGRSLHDLQTSTPPCYCTSPNPDAVPRMVRRYVLFVLESDRSPFFFCAMADRAWCVLYGARITSPQGTEIFKDRARNPQKLKYSVRASRPCEYPVLTPAATQTCVFDNRHSASQIAFHKLHASAAASPVEHCRRHLHIASIIADLLSIVFFAMVVGGELRLSLFVLNVVQIPVMISLPVLSTRMWIYT